MSDYARRPSSSPEQDLESPAPAADSALSAASMLSPFGAAGMQGLLGNSGVSSMLGGLGGLGGGLGLPGFGLPDMPGFGLPDMPGFGIPEIPGFGLPELPSFSDLNPFSGVGDWLGNKAGEAMDWAGNKVQGAKDWVGNKVDGLKSMGDDFMTGVGQEGWTSVFDPTGVLDRQNAQRELSDRFDVVPNDFVGPRLPNQVTQEEFQRIAHTYSDIRMGRSDINFNTEGLSEEDAAAFRSGSMTDLASIMQTEHGRTLINDLAYNEKDHATTLSPLFQKDAAGNYDPSKGLDTTNGFASADDRSKAFMSADNKTAGVGTDSRVRYNPGINSGPPDGIDAWLPFRSDVLLYHELTHSRDHTLGTLANGVDPATGENLREQRAAGLGAYSGETISENAYRRDRRLIAGGGTGVRDGDATMPDRTSYFYHTAPAPAPGGGASTGPGSPGVARDPHGDHDD